MALNAFTWTLAALISTATVYAELTVHCYDHAGLGSRRMDSAIRVANRAFSQAKIPVRWVSCTGAAAGECSRETGPLVYEVSIVASRLGHSGPANLELGHALLNPGGESVYAKIMLPKVAQFAGAMNISETFVLGYAMAHEVGHLILGVPEHASFGIMKAVWSPADKHMITAERLQFHDQEVKAMQRRIR